MKAIHLISRATATTALKRGVGLCRAYYLPTLQQGTEKSHQLARHRGPTYCSLSTSSFHTSSYPPQFAATAMDFVVDKKDLHKCSSVVSPPLVIKEGEILLKINKFSFTANNISYGATGDALKYWEFFPAAANTTTRQGRIPVWGVATIVASRCSGLQEGRKVYGYFPMSHFVVSLPIKANHADFIDGLPHRRELPALYNQYFLCDEDPFYTPRIEDAMMVLRPLFLTSWLLVDFFTHPTNCTPKPFFGSQSTILSSASSKTSIGLAFQLHQYNRQQQQQQSNKIHVVGLTSARHFALVQSLQIYDEIIVYDDLESQLDNSRPSCFVDMAGNTRLTTRIHNHLGDDNAKYTCLVGAAHVGQGGKPTTQLPGARPKFFFAPSWAAQRAQEMGHGNKRRGLQIMMHQVLLDYRNFVNWCLGVIDHNLNESEDGGKPWLHMKYYQGPQQVAKGYAECLQGEVEPDTAVIMSLWESDPEQQHPTTNPSLSKL